MKIEQNVVFVQCGEGQRIHRFIRDTTVPAAAEAAAGALPPMDLFFMDTTLQDVRQNTGAVLPEYEAGNVILRGSFYMLPLTQDFVLPYGIFPLNLILQ